MGVASCIFVIVVIVVLFRYVLFEGQRIKSQKKFMKNMDEFDSNKIKNDKR